MSIIINGCLCEGLAAGPLCSAISLPIFFKKSLKSVNKAVIKKALKEYIMSLPLYKKAKHVKKKI